MAYELTAPNGGHVTVETEERAKQLEARGYKPVVAEKKPAPRKRASAKKEQ